MKKKQEASEEEMLDKLKYTKEELEMRNRIIHEMDTATYVRLTDDELLVLTNAKFGKEEK